MLISHRAWWSLLYDWPNSLTHSLPVLYSLTYSLHTNACTQYWLLKYAFLSLFATKGNPIDSSIVSNISSNLDTGCMSDGQSSISGSLSAHSSGQRTKRMRTSFKHHQLRTMKSYFSINQNPDAKDLKQLAQKTGLSKRVLQVSATFFDSHSAQTLSA